MDKNGHISLPNDLLEDAERFETYALATSLDIEVSREYIQQLSENKALPEVIGIQRLISLARRGIPLRVKWHKQVADHVFDSPNLFPLLAVVLCLDNASHELIRDDGSVAPINVQSSRQLIYKFRAQADLFSDTQILLCADSRGQGRPKSLYSSNSSGLIARADFESLIDRLLAGQAAINVSSSQAVTFSQSIATIVAELFENTDIHGRLGLDGVPFKTNGIRGLVFKRVKITQKIKRDFSTAPSPTEQAASENDGYIVLDALEISVFDSGVGFYSSYTQQARTLNTPLVEEWKIMHKCLERHYDISIPDTRSSHTGMGLYEVLRALKFVHGMLEVRSGKTYGYRTFLEGELQYQLESRDSSTRPGMPKPVLLDVTRQFVTVPSPHEALAGASVRVLIPLR